MNKGISSITYDQFGNPFKVTFGNKSSIEYVYSADGVKLKARHITAIPQGTGSSWSSTNYIMSKDSTDYIGDFIYHNNRFSRYNWGNGYVAPLGNSYTYRFYIRDHQGNNRVVTTSTGTVKQTTHYYPDGVTHDKSTGQGEQVYKYNGKELDRMHGLDWYDYGAREYDPTTGMFTSMDPLCEKYYHISPYAYCAGNPVRYVDPDGKDWYSYNGKYQWVNSTNNTYNDESGNKWKNIGHTYTDQKTGTYYSLFGQSYGKGHKDLKAVRSIDNAIIEYSKYEAHVDDDIGSECVSPPKSYFGDAYKFIEKGTVLAEPNEHKLAYGEHKVNTTYRVLNNKENSYAQGIEVFSAIDLGSYGFRKHEKGIGVRFQNANRYDNVIVIFSPSAGVRNMSFYRKLVGSFK